MATFELDGYDSPETAQTPSEPEPELSWRSDPAASHSDWTIVVCGAKDGSRRTFHVHKNQLSVGPRRSDYFGAIFRTTLAEGAAARSKLDLQASAAAAFPKLLDYSYSGRIEFDDKNVAETTALMHLAHYLRIRKLYDATRTFVQSHLKPSTAPEYACEANLYSMEKLVHAAITLCADNLDSPLLSDALTKTALSEFPTDLFTRVLEQSSKSSAVKSIHITRYCRQNSDDVNTELFERFCRGIDQVDPQHAVELLSYAVRRGFVAGSETQNVCDICIRDAAASRVGADYETAKPAWTLCIKTYDLHYNHLPDSEKVKLLESGLTAALRSHESFCVWSPGNGMFLHRGDSILQVTPGPLRNYHRLPPPPTLYVKNN
mmetsp:Transcript_18300/g.56341  ORF Transcript_18300/g.56341 Transcript_18300/m.56341 type:complete len:375 (+) Transcript_18300:513-1637(+)